MLSSQEILRHWGYKFIGYAIKGCVVLVDFEEICIIITYHV